MHATETSQLRTPRVGCRSMTLSTARGSGRQKGPYLITTARALCISSSASRKESKDVSLPTRLLAGPNARNFVLILQTARQRSSSRFILAGAHGVPRSCCWMTGYPRRNTALDWGKSRCVCHSTTYYHLYNTPRITMSEHGDRSNS